LLVLAFRGVVWADLWRSLNRVNLVLVLAAVALLAGSLVARAFRWQALLTPFAHTPFSDACSYTLIGYLVNNVLGLRLGEVVRAGLLGEKSHTSKSSVLATVVLERLLDVLSLLGLVAILLVMLDLPPIVRDSILLVEAMAVLIVILLGVMAWRGGDIGHLLPGFLPSKLYARLSALLVSFAQGLRVLKSGKDVLIATAWSLLSWILFAGSTLLFMMASSLSRLPWYAALLVVVVTNLGSAIPSSPGFVGGFHFLVVFSLKLWAVPQGDALGFAVLVHGVDYVVVTMLGVVALLRENIAFRQLRRRAQEQV
jgi:uncharacterized protein (TIRG00374 family)